jgi:hypothetical protein
MARERSLAAGGFLLVLEGTQAGFLRSVDGGAAVGEVVSEQGSGFFSPKHLASVRFEPLTLAFDLSLDKTVFQWIGDTWRGVDTRHSGSIVSTSFDLKPVSEREFRDAVITSVTIPALDGSSKDPAAFTVQLAAEEVVTKKPSGGTVKAPGVKQKLWLPSNFRLAIDGLETKRVSRIDAFTVTRATAAEQVGEHRIEEAQPSKVEFPNLRITLAEADAESWVKWHDDFVLKGNNDDAHEKSGSLTFLAANMQDVLGEIRFFNLGIFRLASSPRTAGAEQPARMVADLYCERMELTINS